MPDGPSVVVDLYSADAVIGMSKSASFMPRMTPASWAAPGVSSLQL